MDSNRKIVMTAGILFLIGTIVGILSVAPAIDTPDYLIQASLNINQIIPGAVFQFIMAVVYISIAVSLFPVLRKFNESLALGFLCFRIIAAVYLILFFPIASQELILALWLIIKGFNSSVIADVRNG